MARPRILFVAEAVTLAHVGRPLTLASALDRERYDIFFACDPRGHWAVSSAALEVRALSSLPTELFLRRLDTGAPVYSPADLESYLQDDLRLIDAVRPDLIVGDFRVSLSVSARLRRVPYAAISNAHWSPYTNLVLPAPRTLCRVMGERAAQFVFNSARPIGFYFHTRALNALRRKHGLAPLPNDVRYVYTDADHVLYDDTPELIMTRPLPAQHRFLGPIIWSPPLPTPAWWDQVPADKPVVYVGFGSSGASSLLSTALSALAALPVTVIAATSGQRVPAALASALPFVSAYLPGEASARRAAVVMCNGGSGTTKQALAAGRPVLGVITNMDQHLGMRAIADRGAGVLLRKQASSADIARALRRILETPSYRDNAEKIAQEFKKYSVAERFRQFVAEIFGEA